MSTTWISRDLRNRVFARADGSCEYCLMAQSDMILRCQIDHIIGEKHGGLTQEDNHAIAYVFCNQSKGSDIGSIDFGTGEFVRFFNPRRDVWSEHFRFVHGRIEGITPVGMATVRILRLNDMNRIVERLILMEIERYPSAAALAKMAYDSKSE